MWPWHSDSRPLEPGTSDFARELRNSDVPKELYDKLVQLSLGTLPADLRLEVLYPLPGAAAFYINDHNVTSKLFDWALDRTEGLKKPQPGGRGSL